MQVERTQRGFPIARFDDANEKKCSIQESSAVGNYAESLSDPGSSFLWLGIDDVDARVMASEAASVGVVTDQKTGWVGFPIPSNVSITTRMHLNREQVKELVELMQLWLETGTIAAE